MGLDPSIAGAAISSGANILGSVVDAISVGRQNKKARQYADEVYAKQRKDSLSDWNMQNEYNSPSAQMGRYKAAGLNPNLIYGQTNTAAPVRSSAPQSWHPQPIKSGIGEAVSTGIQTFQDMRVKNAQLSQMEQQTNLLKEEAKLRTAQIASTLASTDFTKNRTDTGIFDLGLKNDLRQTSVDAQKQSLRKLVADTQFTIDTNARAGQLQPNRMKALILDVAGKAIDNAKSQEQINEIKARTANILKDSRLKDFEIKLNQVGLSKHDNVLSRVIYNAITSGHSPVIDSFLDDAGVDKSYRKKPIYDLFKPF